jgi:hypothetical protein
MKTVGRRSSTLVHPRGLIKHPGAPGFTLSGGLLQVRRERFRIGSENVQVMSDDHLRTIQLTNLLQQGLLWIWPPYPAGVRTVIQDQ